MKRFYNTLFGMRWLSVSASLLLSSCLCLPSMAIRETYQFNASAKKEDAFAFYRLGEQYYMACDVTYELERDGLTCGSWAYAPDVTIPISVKREPVRRRYYFLMPPEVTQKVLGAKPPKPDRSVRDYIPADEWDATAAEQVFSPIKKAEIQMSTGVMYSPVRCRYYSDPPQFTLHAPIYRPWDYWVKMPLSLAVFVAVDVPCTLATNAVMLAGELVTYPFVAPFLQYVEPTEVKQVAEKE